MWKYGTDTIANSEFLLYSSLIEMLEFDDDVFAAGNFFSQFVFFWFWWWCEDLEAGKGKCDFQKTFGQSDCR